ncbi:MAG: LuxR family transcriptional regulator [Caulobacteraceae bacterium]
MALANAADELLSVYDRLNSAQDLQQLQAGCTAVLSEVGGYYFAAGLFDPRQGQAQRVIAVDYPAAWVEHYFANRYMDIDPTVTTAAHRAAPYDWDFAAARGTAAAPVFTDIYDLGVRSGVTVPVHMPGGATFVASFAGTEQADARRRPLLTCVAVLLHEHFSRLDARSRAVAPTLTSRERDCLSWVARGKTSWEIGEILGVAERTVNFHLNNAFAKLDTSGRTMAVVRAITLGLINP